jgi:glutamine synthetase
LKNLADLIDECFGKIQSLKKDLSEAEKAEEGYVQAALFAEKVVPGMSLLRQVLDQLEERVSDNHWPLPKYQEMLFTR